jgi:lipoate-protein ligase A
MVAVSLRETNFFSRSEKTTINPMRRLDLTLPTPAENVALDDALLDWAETENPDWEFLRLWESPRPVVVVGRSTRVEQEVDSAACRKRDIAILRRSSGGASIVAGPGCLMYALVLSYQRRPELKDIRRAHANVLNRFAAALNVALAQVGIVAHVGTSDLTFVPVTLPAVTQKKFSGNSMRARRTHLLYHGTLLYNFDLPLIETCLRQPPRQPEYRAQRLHAEFVMNLPIARQALVEAVHCAWPTESEVADGPIDRVARLVAERFSRDEWNLEFP